MNKKMGYGSFCPRTFHARSSAGVLNTISDHLCHHTFKFVCLVVLLFTHLLSPLVGPMPALLRWHRREMTLLSPPLLSLVYVDLSTLSLSLYKLMAQSMWTLHWLGSTCKPSALSLLNMTLFNPLWTLPSLSMRDRLLLNQPLLCLSQSRFSSNLPHPLPSK